MSSASGNAILATAAEVYPSQSTRWYMIASIVKQLISAHVQCRPASSSAREWASDTSVPKIGVNSESYSVDRSEILKLSGNFVVTKVTHWRIRFLLDIPLNSVKYINGMIKKILIDLLVTKMILNHRRKFNELHSTMHQVNRLSNERN